MNNIVGLKDLRENINAYIDQVKKGHSFTIVRRSKPVFNITPPEEESQWETVVDFTKIKKGGVIIDDVIKAIKKLR